MRKSNKAYRSKPARLSLIERAMLRQAWTRQGIDAQIHALGGNNVAATLEKAGTLFWTVLQAAQVEGVAEDDRDVRVLCGACNTLGDLAGRDAMTDLQRGALSAGLDATRMLAARLDPNTLAMAAAQLRLKLDAGPVTLGDFPNIHTS